MLNVFNMYGIRTDEVNNRTHKLNLELLTNPEFPIPIHRQDQLTVSFDRKIAVSNEDIEFLSWDHPTVFGAIDLILGSEKGNATIAKWDGAASNEILLEAIFVLECVAPKSLNVDRFLPPSPIRVVVNHSLQDCSNIYSEKKFTKNLKNNKSKNVLDHPKIKHELFPKMLETCNKIAEEHVNEIIKNGLQQMELLLKRELNRLIELRKVNANIKAEELTLCQQEIDLSREAINSARLRLDGLRLIIKESSNIS